MTGLLLIDEVANALYKKRNQYMRDYCKVPKLAIYMSTHFYYDCLQGVVGPVSPEALQFYEKSTILDVPVYIVNNDKHPSWRIVAID